MTARVKKVIEELAELSPPEMAELAARFRELRAVDDGGNRVCRNADLIRFLGSHALDPRTLVGKKPPHFDLSDEDVEPVVDGDGVVLSPMPEWGSGPSGCDHRKIQCNVVWADACNARAAVACEASWVGGPSRGDEDPEDGCPPGKTLVRELTLR